MYFEKERSKTIAGRGEIKMKIEKLDCTLTIIFAIIFSLLGGFVAGVFFELNVQKDAIQDYRLPLKARDGYHIGFAEGYNEGSKFSYDFCLQGKFCGDNIVFEKGTNLSPQELIDTNNFIVYMVENKYKYFEEHTYSYQYFPPQLCFFIDGWEIEGKKPNWICVKLQEKK